MMILLTAFFSFLVERGRTDEKRGRNAKTSRFTKSKLCRISGYGEGEKQCLNCIRILGRLIGSDLSII